MTKKQEYSVTPYRDENGKDKYYVNEGEQSVLGPYKTYAEAERKANKLNGKY